MMCAENRISMSTGINEIFRGNVKTTKKEINANSNKTGGQRFDKRHISEDKCKAFECSEESDISTAEFSLNEPPACSWANDSAY